MLKEERKCLTSIGRPINIRNLTPQRDSPIPIKNLTLQGDSRSFRKVKEEKKISPLINATIVIRWDILLIIVQPEGNNTKRNKRHHSHTVENEESPTKMNKEEFENYVLFFVLLGSVSPGKDTWLIDSGASKHMTGQRDILSSLTEKSFPQKVTLGDDYQYQSGRFHLQT
jgi:hypothetical protein